MTWGIYVRGHWVFVPDWFYNIFIDRRWIHNLRYWRKIRSRLICSCCQFCKIVQNEDEINIGVCDNELSKHYQDERYPDDTCKLVIRTKKCRITWCERYNKCFKEKEPNRLNRLWVILSQWLSQARSRNTR